LRAPRESHEDIRRRLTVMKMVRKVAPLPVREGSIAAGWRRLTEVNRPNDSIRKS
jgi:hypothetical protein